MPIIVIWEEMDRERDREIRARARVLGVLSPGTIDVIVAPGVGLADGGVQHKIPLDMVPVDLRLPNSEFLLVLDRVRHRFTRVERLEKTR